MDDGTVANEWAGEAYDESCSFVYEEATGLLDFLDPAAGERIVDVGCGTGRLTREIADAGADVVGLDRSPAMVRRAREAHPDLAFVRGDARTLPVDDLDAAFSNAALHWVTDQDATVGSIAAALRPGGRFVAELGGTGNVAAITGAVAAELADRGYDGEHPWYFPTPSEYASLLETHGFEVRLLRLFDRPTPLEGGKDGLATWLETFGDGWFEPLSDADLDAVVAGVEERLRDDLFEAGRWVADYRRLRVFATLEHD